MIRGVDESGRTFSTQTVGTRPSRNRTSGTASDIQYRNLRSRWMILINTNIDYEKHQHLPFDETMDCLEKAANDLVNQQNELVKAHILKYYHFTHKGRHSLGSRMTETPPNPYTHGKVLQAFERAPNTNYLHQHIDLTVDHSYGEGAFALQLDRMMFYEYIAQRLYRETGQDFFQHGHELFIRIRRVNANMAKSYLNKAITQSEIDAAKYEKNQMLTAPWVSKSTVDMLTQ